MRDHVWSYVAVLDKSLSREEGEAVAHHLVERSGSRVVGEASFYAYNDRAFNLVYHIAESHLVISTYPENNRTVVDFSTCVDFSSIEEAKRLFIFAASQVGADVVFFAPVYVPLRNRE